MQQRPIRSQLYLPVLRFGITDEDWGVVILASSAGYAIPFLLGWKIYAIPAELIGWLLLMGLSVLTLNLIRRKSRPGWLKHTLQARLCGRVRHRWLPGETCARWLKLK
jgi:hypothetical protein